MGELEGVSTDHSTTGTLLQSYKSMLGLSTISPIAVSIFSYGKQPTAAARGMWEGVPLHVGHPHQPSNYWATSDLAPGICALISTSILTG